MPVDAATRPRPWGGLLRTAALAAVVAVALAGGAGGGVGPRSAAPRVLDAAPVSFTDPAPPASLSLAPGDQQITASWPASTEASVRGYVVSVDGTARPEQTGLSVTLTGLTNGRTYTVAVRTVTYNAGLIGIGAQGPNTGTQSTSTSTYPRDAVAPAAPASTTATVGDGQVVVGWAANTTDADVAGYVVYRNGAAVSGLVAKPATSWTDTGLTNDTTYTYTVRTQDLSRNLSVDSPSKTATPTDLTPPAVPTGLTAVRGDGQVSLSWTASPEADLASYGVYRGGALVATVQRPATAYTDTGLVNGTAYSYTLDAVDTHTNRSARSSPAVSATPADLTPPPAPTGVVVSAAPNTLTVSWNAVAAADLKLYRVMLDGNVIGTVQAGTTTLTTAGLTGAATHTITVVAVDTAGNASAPSAPVTASHLDKTPPSVPTGTTATPLDAAVRVSWNAVTDTDLSTYTVYRDGVAVATIPAGTTTATVTGLTNGTRYAFTVAAVDTSGNASAPSAAASATPVDTTPPPVPTGVRATGGDHALTVSWTAVAAADLASYRVLLDGAVVATVPAGTTTATLTGLVEGRSYTVTVVAVDTTGNASAPSAPLTATPADTTPPAAPTGVTASPGPESLAVAWTAVTAPDVAYYRVLVDGAVAGTSTGTSATVSGLTGGRAYTVTVVAVDASGNTSAPSAPVTATPVDTTPPPVPTGLTATPSDGTVALTWTGVAAADLAGYEVLQDGAVIATVPAGTTSYTATGLTNGRSYSFAVRAVDTAGNRSAASAAVSATPADTTPPAAPTGVTATPGPESLTVSWTAVTAPDVAYYRVLVDGAVAATPTGTSAVVSGLIGGRAYTVTVVAVDAAGNASAPSAPVTATPVDTTPPPVPTGLTATPSDGAVALTWTAVAAADLAGYEVLQDGVLVATTTSTSYTATGLTNGRTYSFAVRAVDTAGNRSAASTAVSATPAAAADTTPPAAPTGVTATPGPESLTITWTAVSAPDLAYYRVLLDGAVAATPTGTTATVSGLTGGRAYTVTVVAVDSSGNASAPSAPVTATPVDTTPPAVPTGLTATPGDTTVALSWTGVTAPDLAGYEVLQDGVPVATTTSTTYTATGLTNGRSYSFAVRAVDTAGNRSATSTAVSATPAAAAPPADTTPPATPTGVQATSGDGQVTVSWAPVTDADLASYQVLQDGAVVATVPAGTTTYTVTGLANGTNHTFTVRAVDTAGNTSASATAVVATPAPTTPPATPTGTPATGAGEGEGLAATRDGRYVVLGTRARLEASDTNSAYELYLLDRVAGTARRVAPLPSTWAGTGTDSTNGSAVALSSSGRYLALTTTAKLVAADTNSLLDAYRLDLTTGAAQLVSVPASGAVSSATAGAVAPTASGSAYATRASVAISADGSRVLFYSARADLVTGDTNGAVDLFAKDASGGATGAVTRVSTTATGANLPRTVQGPALALTPDGRYALFPATSSTGPVVLYRKDLTTKDLVVVSTVVSGTTTTDVGVFRDSGDVAISDDGNQVVFSTSNKVGTSTPGATWSTGLAYRKDVATGALVPLGDGQTTAWEHQTTLDPTGRYAFFETSAGEVPGDTNGHTDTYRRDLQTGALVLVTADASGAAAASPSGPVDPKEYGPILVLSADTVLVATLQPLVAGDTNGLKDVYRKDLSTQAVSSAV